MADHPLRSATRRRLGRLLPHQLADRPQTPPKAHCCFTCHQDYAVLATISRGYSPLQGRLSTCYAPVRHSTEVACDLHVLSMPPMFILSQDQTLHESLIHVPLRTLVHSTVLPSFWLRFYHSSVGKVQPIPASLSLRRVSPSAGFVRLLPFSSVVKSRLFPFLEWLNHLPDRSLGDAVRRRQTKNRIRSIYR